MHQRIARRVYDGLRLFRWPRRKVSASATKDKKLYCVGVAGRVSELPRIRAARLGVARIRRESSASEAVLRQFSVRALLGSLISAISSLPRRTPAADTSLRRYPGILSGEEYADWPKN